MSILSWFTRKSAPVPARNMEPSGLLNPEATIPLVPGLYGRQMPEPAAPEHAANRKNERMERRELLYTVVRDAMVRAGVLSASYKFKVLSLDQRGSQFVRALQRACCSGQPSKNRRCAASGPGCGKYPTGAHRSSTRPAAAPGLAARAGSF